MKSPHAIFLILISLCFASCVDHDKDGAALREKIIAEGVQIRIAEFREREETKCLEQARQIAIAQVDSLIRVGARLDPIEPVIKPPKPERPEKPEPKVLPDSVRAKAKKDSIN